MNRPDTAKRRRLERAPTPPIPVPPLFTSPSPRPSEPNASALVDQQGYAIEERDRLLIENAALCFELRQMTELAEGRQRRIDELTKS